MNAPDKRPSLLRVFLRRIILTLSTLCLLASIALWIASVYAPKVIHWNRGPNLGQSISLIPHRILIVSLEFPPDPDAQTASKLRPRGIYAEDIDRRLYDSTFAWLSLGFQKSSGPYPHMIMLPTGAMLYLRLHLRVWVIPLWIFPPVFAIVPNFYFLAFLRRTRPPRDRLCTKCRYNLRAHKPGDKCPECGIPVQSLSA